MKKTGERRVVRSGENIPEAMRKTSAVKVRLSPRTAEHIRWMAKTSDLTVSEIVEAGIAALQLAVGGPAAPEHGTYGKVLDALAAHHDKGLAPAFAERRKARHRL